MTYHSRILRNGIVLMFAAGLVVGPARGAGPTAPPPTKWSRDEVKAVTGWLGERAIPLSSVRAGAGFDDLRPLKSILKDVRVVGLGDERGGPPAAAQLVERGVAGDPEHPRDLLAAAPVEA